MGDRSEEHDKQELLNDIANWGLNVEFGLPALDEESVDLAENCILCQQLCAADSLSETVERVDALQEDEGADGCGGEPDDSDYELLGQIYCGEDSARLGSAGNSEKGYGGNFARI